MTFLGISGSLRAASSSTRLLRALPALLPEGARWATYEGIGGLPHFNPDLDEEGMAPPAPVAALRQSLRDCEAAVFCAPEYAHGVPGSLKNALDWVVSSGELNGKPVAVIVPGGGEHALASLVEILRTMDARMREGTCLNVPHVRQLVGAAGQIADPQLRTTLTGCLAELHAQLAARAR